MVLNAVIRRHPNYIWDQLANDSLWASFIVDGFHLPPNVVKVMTRAKGHNKSILVTDAVTIAGLTPGEYTVEGVAVELSDDGIVRLTGTEYLAGAALKMPDAVFNTVQFTDIERGMAIDMASHHPNTLLERYTNISLDVFSERTFTLFHWGTDGLKIIATIIDGEIVFSQIQTTSEGD